MVPEVAATLDCLFQRLAAEGASPHLSPCLVLEMEAETASDHPSLCQACLAAVEMASCSQSPCLVVEAEWLVMEEETLVVSVEDRLA